MANTIVEITIKLNSDTKENIEALLHNGKRVSIVVENNDFNKKHIISGSISGIAVQINKTATGQEPVLGRYRSISDPIFNSSPFCNTNINPTSPISTMNSYY